MAHDQPTLLTFTDRQGHTVGDSDIEILPESVDKIPGVVGDDVKIPGVESSSDEINIQPLGDANDPGIMPTTQPGPDTAAIVEPDPETNTNYEAPSDAIEPSTDALPDVIPDSPVNNNNDAVPFHPSNVETRVEEPAATRRSSRTRSKPTSYVPSMKGKTYDYSAMQTSNDTYDPRVVETVLTQLTLKAAIKM